MNPTLGEDLKQIGAGRNVVQDHDVLLTSSGFTAGIETNRTSEDKFQMKKDTADWKLFEHEKRIEREKKEETAMLRDESQQQINRHVKQAKVDFQALGDSLAAQKTAFEASFIWKMRHFEPLESNLRKLTANYAKDKLQLEKKKSHSQ
jgi:hypothetical protein